MELNYDNKEKYTRITEDGELIIDDVITEINSNTFVVPKDEKDSFFDSFIVGENNGIKHLNLDVKKVRIPEGVTKIRKELFSNFKNLEEVILPESLNEIEIDAFRECINLKKINIPNNVEKIGERAFQDCEVLENIELPEKIELIESFAFSKLSKIK